MNNNATRSQNGGTLVPPPLVPYATAAFLNSWDQDDSSSLEDDRKPAAVYTQVPTSVGVTNLQHIVTPLMSPRFNLGRPPPLCSIPWRRSIYEHTPPPRATEQEAMRRLNASMFSKYTTNNAVYATTKSLCRQLLSQLVRNAAESSYEWRPRELKSIHTRGIYMLVGTDGTIKVGMSFRVYSRVNRQPHKYAGLLLSPDQINALIPDSFVDSIVALELPGLVFHKDHVQYLRDLIRTQAAEAAMACLYKTKPGPLLERFFQGPSDTVAAAVVPATFSNAAIEFLQGIPDGGVHFGFTWPTLKSRLYDIMAERNSNYLRQMLRPRASDEFVTLNRARISWGAKFGSWKNAIAKSPREVALEKVVGKLDQLLEGNITYHPSCKTCYEIRQALLPLQGENKSHYVRPHPSVQARYSLELLRQHIVMRPVDHVHSLERWAFCAILKHFPNALEEIMNMDKVLQEIPEDPWALALFRTTSGHRVVVTSSDFVVAAVGVRRKSRFHSARNYLRKMELLAASGNISVERLENERKIIRSFLMALEFGDEFSASEVRRNGSSVLEEYKDGYEQEDDFGNDNNDSNLDNANDDKEDPMSGFRLAIRCMFPAGFFDSNVVPIVSSVAGSLGIGYYECLFLAEFLGLEKIHKLLIAHGLAVQGRINPMDPSWECEGVPAAGSISAEPCANAKSMQGITCVGKRIQNHVFSGMFMCNVCQRKLPRREMEIYKIKKVNDESMLHNEKERLDELHKRRLHDRELHKMTTAVRASNRNKQVKRKGRQKPLHYKTGKANAKKGFFETKSGRYPKAMIKKLADAVKIFVGLYGQEEVASTMLIKVCHIVLLRDWQTYGIAKPELLSQGPCYHKGSYLEAIETHMEKCSTRGYRILHANHFRLVPSGEPFNVLLDQVTSKLYTHKQT